MSDIRFSMEAIERYIARIDERQFLESRLLQDAVVRRLEMISEASRRLSDDFKLANAAIDWKRWPQPATSTAIDTTT